MSLIRIIYISLPILASVAGLYAYKTLDKSLKLILLYSVIGFCTEFMLWIAVKSGVRNTMPPLHFYVMVEFLIWGTFYMNLLKNYLKVKYLLILIIVFEIFCVINMIFIQKLTEYAHTRSVENLVILLLAVIFYAKVMTEQQIEKLVISPFIWVNTVVLIYFAGNFFYNIVFIPLLKNDVQFLKTISLYIFATLNTLFYIGI